MTITENTQLYTIKSDDKVLGIAEYGDLFFHIEDELDEFDDTEYQDLYDKLMSHDERRCWLLLTHDADYLAIRLAQQAQFMRLSPGVWFRPVDN